MKKTKTNKKILYGGLILILLLVVVGVLIIKNKKTDEAQYTTPNPEEVVRQYFTAWNNKNYPDMYATISDGFKRIDPNAKDLTVFRNFASTQGIEGVSIISVQEESNDGATAIVDYTIEFTLSDGRKQEFSDKFSLKFRQADVIPGWKLIHPYGENVDTS